MPSSQSCIGPIELRYYGLFFALGLLLAARAAPDDFESYGLPREHGERLTSWIPIGMLLGAHYFHLIFLVFGTRRFALFPLISPRAETRSTAPVSRAPSARVHRERP